MDVWSKAAISTFLGFMAGLAAEPLKALLQERHKRKVLKRLLYRDLANLEFALNSLISLEAFSNYQRFGLDDLHFEDLRTDLFDWAFGTSKELFYRLEEFQPLIFIYGRVKKLAAVTPSDDSSYQVAHSDVQRLLAQIRRMEEQGVLDSEGFRSARVLLAEFLTKFRD